MAEFRQGQLHRPLRAVAFTETALVNFPSEFPGGVTFHMVSGSTVIDGTADGDASGNLTYQWQTGDLDVLGTYEGYFIGTDGSGKTQTFPDTINLVIVVVPTK